MQNSECSVVALMQLAWPTANGVPIWRR